MPKVFTPPILLIAGLGILAISPAYYFLSRLGHANASLFDIYLRTAMFVTALLVGYELFFAVQRMGAGRPAQTICSRLDRHIPFVVQWVWIYGFFYYGLLGLPISFLGTLADCLICICGGLVLLLVTSIIYLFWPTSCPTEWRSFAIAGVSGRLIKFIQELDSGRSCCPSLHCTLAAYTATFIPSYVLLLAIPMLISASCLFVKQHSILDLPPSLALGFAMGAIINHLI